VLFFKIFQDLTLVCIAFFAILFCKECHGHQSVGRRLYPAVAHARCFNATEVALIAQSRNVFGIHGLISIFVELLKLKEPP
jgi:hypothetical protein